MHRVTLAVIAAVVAALAVTAVASAGTTKRAKAHRAAKEIRTQHFRLDPSNGKLANCMPGARIDAYVDLATDAVGFDQIRIRGRHLAPNRDYTMFLLEDAEAPFGAAEYIGDISSDSQGDARNTLRLIGEEAFASTLVDGKRVRVDLNRVGAWFADPADDDFCLGKGSPVTPFDGDDEAGVQAFNSRNAAPLP
jgi:hypothetical protein